MDPASLSPADRAFHMEIISLGRADEVAGAILSANLQEFLGLPAVVSPPWPVPDYAHLPARNQYDAGLILEHFYRDLPPEGLRLGLTALGILMIRFRRGYRVERRKR